MDAIFLFNSVAFFDRCAFWIKKLKQKRWENLPLKANLFFCDANCNYFFLRIENHSRTLKILGSMNGKGCGPIDEDNVFDFTSIKNENQGNLQVVPVLPSHQSWARQSQ